MELNSGKVGIVRLESRLSNCLLYKINRVFPYSEPIGTCVSGNGMVWSYQDNEA